MNILPGLRELRAPLAAGYMWLITAWLWLDHFRLIPESRPTGDGWLPRVWGIGVALGAATFLTVLTFVAYLIGSFLEIDIDNVNRVAPRLVRRRARYRMINRREVANANTTPTELNRVDHVVDYLVDGSNDYLQRAIVDAWFLDGSGRSVTLRIANSFSPQGRDALAEAIGPPRRSEQSRAGNGAADMLMSNYYANTLLDYRIDVILSNVIDEMPQLASRLLVKNKELYGRYDRFRSEASFRINVSIALLTLLVTATFLADLHWIVKVALTLIEFAAAVLLFRQGLLRSISARDVIAQAIAIGEVESTVIKEVAAGKSAIVSAATQEDGSGDTDTTPQERRAAKRENDERTAVEST
jgi:hypothetical protein